MSQRILEQIRSERLRQDAKWGQQNHSSVSLTTAFAEDACTDYGIPTEAEAKAACEDAIEHGILSWADIAIEEMCEAVNANGDIPRREELVQLAAVVVAWIECIDRNAQ